MEKFNGTDSSKLAGKTVLIKEGEFKGQEFKVENWQVLAYGHSWMGAKGNPAALKYAMRSGFNGLPTDDNVYYGHIGVFGHMIHASEVGGVVEKAA